MPTTRNRESAAEWAATITDPITAEKAKERLEYALGYADDAVNAVMSLLGTMTPPARSIMPDLYAMRDKVVAARDTIGALAERSPDTHVSKMYVDVGKKLGIDLIDAANIAMDKAKTGESPAQVVEKIAEAGEEIAKKAAKGLIRIGGLMLTPMEAAFGALLIDELLNKGRFRKRILKGF
jgi:hypothetical protein